MNRQDKVIVSKKGVSMNPGTVLPAPATRERLLQTLIETQAFRVSPTPSFQLASGAMSCFYIDCKVGLSFASTREIVGELIFAKIDSRVDAVGGLLIGAYPISIAVS